VFRVTMPVAIDVRGFARELGVPITRIGDVVPGAPGVELRLDGQPVEGITGYNAGFRGRIKRDG